MKLFYVILGATPKGRNTEQHDVFFGIAPTLKELVPAIRNFWPGANGEIHVDAYQEVKFVDGYEITVREKSHEKSENQLFFINLGGYKPGLFGELHDQHLVAADSMAAAVKRAKQTVFYKTMGFKNAESHIDDKYGVDIDDIFRVHDILPGEMKDKYSIILEKSSAENQENQMKLGYFKLSKIQD